MERPVLKDDKKHAAADSSTCEYNESSPDKVESCDLRHHAFRVNLRKNRKPSSTLKKSEVAPINEEEHLEIPTALLAPAISSVQNRPPLPHRLVPTTSVVKSPTILAPDGQRPGAYLVDGMPTDVNNLAENVGANQSVGSPHEDNISLTDNELNNHSLPVEAESLWYNSKTSSGRQRWYLLGVSVVCVLAWVAIGVGVSFGDNRRKDGTTSKFDAYTDNCGALTGQANPHVLTQCHCHGTIATVASDVTDRYNKLSKSFIASVFPTFHGFIDSCHPRNQALVWLASGDGTPPTFPTTTVMRQRYSLALLFILLGGPDWKGQRNWLSSKDECTWLWVSCDDQGQVTSLLLRANNLTGVIPEEMALLTSLEALDLSTNQLQGGIPDAIFNLSRLSSVNLVGSQLGGTLPVGLAALSLLQTLQLSSNGFTGIIPTEYGRLKSIQTIDLGQNKLTGSLPTEMGLWNQADFLNLGYNRFAGSTIPTELGLLTNLKTLALGNTMLKGRIPKELFNIGRSLSRIDLGSNSFTGTIPTQVGQFINITSFMFGSNQLRGTIPTEFGLTIGLQALDLSSNQLTGTIPTEIGHVKRLTYFILEGNRFTGTVPDAVCEVGSPISCTNNLTCHCCTCVLSLRGDAEPPY